MCQGKSNGTETINKEQTPTTAAADVNLTGVDTSSLTPREKAEWSKYVSEFLSPCPDVPVSVAQCVTEKRTCGRCVPAAKYLVRSVRDGMAREQVETGYKNRFDASKVKSIPIDGSPTKGSENAPVTIVEFADFSCPFCAAYAPVLEKAFEEHKNEVRVVFKFMPLPGHGEPALRSARAGIAAWKVADKFWEMNKKMFANQQHFEQSDLEMYAKDVGVPLDKFKATMGADATKERLAQDQKLADSLQVHGTPSIFINGREFNLKEDINEWIAQEAASASVPGKTVGAVPSASAAVSAATPGASAAPVTSAKAK